MTTHLLVPSLHQSFHNPCFHLIGCWVLIKPKQRKIVMTIREEKRDRERVAFTYVDSVKHLFQLNEMATFALKGNRTNE